MLATVINPLPPAIVFVAAAVVIGMALATLTKKVAVSSLLASAVVVVGFVVSKQHLPLDFWAHAQDFIYEPLIRDHFLRNPGEGVASVIFHFGIPYLITAGLMGYIRRTKIGNERNRASAHGPGGRDSTERSP